MKIKWLWVIVIVLISLVSLSSKAKAEETYTYYACVNNSSGTIKMIDADEVCKNEETYIVWNQAGPIGPQGEPGPQGIPGPQGVPGVLPEEFDLLIARIDYLENRLDFDSDGSPLALDCDDDNPDIYPGAIEICDGLDNDCDQEIDEGCADLFRDDDRDSYGDPEAPYIGGAIEGYVNNSLDCNDSDPAINPSAVEICDGIDNDCDQEVDEGCADWFRDDDGDGYGDPEVPYIGGSIEGYVDNSLDCDDSDPAINPSASEVCDGIDNDCNGFADDGLLFDYYCRDNDGDNYGDPLDCYYGCRMYPDYIPDGGDCDDSNYDINPGVEEIPFDGIDNDCDGVTL